MQETELIPHLFRTEYGKIVAVLCNSFNLRHIEIAEDIASETFLKASEIWGIKGVPENPAAWLYTTAQNKSKDYFKHHSVFENKIKEVLKSNDERAEIDFEFSNENITDSQLAMIFSVCNPDISNEAQICLALQILCGFSVEEIANAFLTKSETIKKRLHRARTMLRDNNFQIKNLNKEEIKSRQDSVLTTLYLLFNEGYFSKTNNQTIRKDLCSEALRLAYILTENPLTNSSQTNALLALMCFQSSRLEARINEDGDAILFDQQDKSLWNKELIEKGNHYLINAYEGGGISKYHLEATIAYWHTTPTDENKWEHILRLYNQLILIEYSPVTALNRTFAFAKVYGNEIGIKEAEKLNLESNSHYYSLLGYLYSDIDDNKAIRHYEQAIALSKSKTEMQTITKEIQRLVEKKDNC
ncbi:MAG: sigma-70 family RNA polymerase sigma factor [Sporocytophaga sp.]|uniref:RNA polymerase sigma factor n=1 Tax=Sporocytophaga sp. TaxID=2231183 RepID=UPI001B1987C2|nr:sigma-70 family RNA polymerase sigma factor [Sporocytophaga sp.]MBO9702996.1 sigma-70 family RNA polymerase sigma factor [Sporocytophaga sp.]